MTVSHRLLQIRGGRDHEWLRKRAVEALDAWARDWIVNYAEDRSRTLEVRVESLAGAVRPLMHQYESMFAEAGCLWIRCTSKDRKTLGVTVGAEQMPGSSWADSWMADAVDCAWGARNRALCSALLGPIASESIPPTLSALPERLFAVGAGAVRLFCDELGLEVFADAAVWRDVPTSARNEMNDLPQIELAAHAVQRANAQLEVVLGTAEVELPQVLDLQCGDVLRLAARLDQGVAVLCEGELLGHAALGQTAGQVSVQLRSARS